MKFTIVYLFLAVFAAVSTAQVVEVTLSGGSGSPLTITTTEDITFTGVTPGVTQYGFYLVGASAGNTTESTSPHSGTISWNGTGDDSGTGTMGALGLGGHELTNVFMLWLENGNAPTTTETMTLTAGSRTSTGNVDADVVVGTGHYQIFMTGFLGYTISDAGTQPQPLTYVDAAADFIITTDQGTPAVLDAGDVVSWQPVSGAAVTGLVFGTNAFTSVQAAVDAVDEGGTVRVAAGTYDEGAEIVISKTMTLEGEGNELTSLSGGGDGDFATVDPSAHRVVYLPTGSLIEEAPHITIRELSIVNGEVAGLGGGILSYFWNSLTMENCTVSGNIASEDGGGVCFYAFGQTAIITDCTFEGNKSMGNGGGLCVYSSPILMVQRSTFYNNDAVGEFDSSGGGIWVREGYATIINSTVSANTATTYGGGIYFQPDNGFYSQFEGLESYLTTGGLNSTTIVKNSAGVEGGGLYGLGLTGWNTQLLIVGNNAPIDPDASRGVVDSIIGFEAAGVDTLEEIIEPLADNGGATLTHKLVWGSNAIDTYTGSFWYMIFNVPSIPTDQRGRPRQFGHYNIGHNVIQADHGAVEYNELEIASSVPANGSTVDTTPSTISMTFNATMGLTYSNLSQVVLKSSGGDVIPCTVTAVDDTITITPDAPLPMADIYSVEINDLVATHETGVTYGPEDSSVMTFAVGANSLLDWRVLHGLAFDGADDFENPSGDGVSNLLKYAFNLAPSAGDLQTSNPSVLIPDGVAGLPLIETIEGPQLSITYVRRKTSSFPGISYQPYTGDDLFGLAPLSQSSATVTSIDDNWERVTLVDPATSESRFGRIEVTE
ncbi:MULTISPECIES: choice-of-anchor Q domain-containing protein [unclassified Lentimonas]|uniref:choice-of-anchor Q domain-containing protein n=1 Tax=unclassified Lentimonas TaxID=2630993 RepID=UPI00132691A1|nr:MULTISPECIES: choice-of-anchor Q domain-containing protein [unclassified Lentimonas]CAA6690796.1 Unannotated [Lentimonas sp. CC19]CAA6693289.1 Unannotated [Lentimonas sp. CC10]CAA7071779.1 Unannotated [Lentimonas sp. CC11]